MGVERREEIKVTKAKDTGFVSVQTTITSVDKRAPSVHLTDKDAIRQRENRKSLEKLKFFGLSGGVVGGVIGGIILISKGFETFNLEQFTVGLGAVALAKYFLDSAKHALYEMRIAGKEKLKIKNTN